MKSIKGQRTAHDAKNIFAVHNPIFLNITAVSNAEILGVQAV